MLEVFFQALKQMRIARELCECDFVGVIYSYKYCFIWLHHRGRFVCRLGRKEAPGLFLRGATLRNHVSHPLLLDGENLVLFNAGSCEEFSASASTPDQTYLPLPTRLVENPTSRRTCLCQQGLSKIRHSSTRGTCPSFCGTRIPCAVAEKQPITGPVGR